MTSWLLLSSRAAGTVAPAAPVGGSPETIPLRINCGGPQYTDASSNLWEADRGYSGSNLGTSVIEVDVAGGATYGQTLFRSDRYRALTYAFTVTNATYRVSLGFAETYWTAVGERVFNVAIEGSTVLSNYDIIADVGGNYTAAVKSFVVTVSDGTLTIVTSNGTADVPSIRWILVEAYTASPPSAIADLAITPGDGQVSLTFTPAPNSTQTNLYWDTTSTVTTADTKVANIQSGYTLTGRTNGVQLWAKVEAENAAGVSSLSNLVTATPAAAPTTGIHLYVETDGDDSKDGSNDTTEALLSLIGVRNRLRVMTGRTVTGGAPPLGWQGATIHIGNGYYRQTATLELDERDSGNSSFPVVWQATNAGAAIATGAYAVAATDWDVVTSGSDGYSQMDAAYRDGMYQLNVGPSGLNIDLGAVLNHGQTWPLDCLNLIVADEIKPMSKYPAGSATDSASWLSINAVTNPSGANWTATVPSTIPSDWNFSGQSIVAQGVWGDGTWVNQFERITAATLSGGSSVLAYSRTGYYTPLASVEDSYQTFLRLRNMLNVIGKGEYAWRRDSGYLTYRPTDAEASAWSVDGTRPATYLTLLDTVMTLGVDGQSSRAANYVEFDGLVFEGARVFTVQAFGSTGLTFTDCEMRNSGFAGWRIEDATDFTISGGSTHDCMTRAGYIHGGDKATLTQGNLTVENHPITDIYEYPQGNVVAALQFTKFDGSNSCGVLIDNVDVTNVWDGAIAIGGPHTTMRNCTIDRACMLTGDAGAVTTQGEYAYDFTDIHVLIEDNTFQNIIRHPKHHISYGAIFAIYQESNTYWIVQDNVFNTCDCAIQIACGKNNIFRRNKMTSCWAGQHKASVVFSNRVGYEENTVGIEAGLAGMAVQNEPYLSSAPRLTAFRAGQPENDVLLYHDDQICVDNWADDGHPSAYRIFKVAADSATWADVGVYQVGVDPTQLNYVIGASLAGSGGLPVLGGGTTAISSLD